jgi:hypothetical protein
VRERRDVTPVKERERKRLESQKLHVGIEQMLAPREVFRSCALCGANIEQDGGREIGGRIFCADADGCRTRAVTLLESARQKERDLRTRIEKVAEALPPEYAKKLKATLARRRPRHLFD